MKKLGLTLLWAGLLTAAPAWAADDFGDFDLGMEAPSVTVDESQLPEESQGPLAITGFFKEELGYSFAKDNPYLSKARTTLNLNFDYKPGGAWQVKANFNYFYDAAIAGPDAPTPTQALLDSMEEEFEIKDFYLDYKFSEDLEFRVGRQIIAWGQSQVSQLNDMANPRDNRELGMVDIEDARLPVTAFKLFYRTGEGQGLDLVSIHEFRPNKMPATGSEFDMMAGLAQSGMTLHTPAEPANFQAEWLMRYQVQGNGGDVAVFASETYEDVPHMVFVGMTGMSPTFDQVYERVSSYGFSANRTLDTWMIRGEMALKQGLWKMRNPQILQSELQSTFTTTAAVQKDVLQAALGVEYMGMEDMMFTAEVAMDQIQDYTTEVYSDETTLVGTFSMSHDSLNDQWNNRIFWFRFFPNEGDVIRWDSTYQTDTPGLSVAGGLIFYEDQGATSFLGPFGKNDRAFASVKYYY